MKKLTTLVLIATISVASLFAATEYTTTAITSGLTTGLEGPYIGCHVSYQFGADFSDDFNFGFGSTVDIDVPALTTDYDAGVTLIFGPAFGVNTNSWTTVTAIFGPTIDILAAESGDEEDDVAGFGIGGTLAVSIYPPAERNARVSLGFTAGATAKMMLCETGNPYIGVNGFVGITLFGDMMYNSMYYYDPYEAALEAIFD